MKIKIKRISPDAIIPKYAHEGDAGFDLYSIEDCVIEPGERRLIKTGLQVEIPRGYELKEWKDLKRKIDLVQATESSFR